MQRPADGIEITVDVLVNDDQGGYWDLKTIRLPSHTLEHLAKVLQDYKPEDW